MTQYQTGTVTVTNGSATVTGSGTAWLNTIQPGHVFVRATIISGQRVDDAVYYTVAAVQSNTQLTLTAAYGGTSGSGQPYGITGELTPGGIPLLAQRSIGSVPIFNGAVLELEQKANQAESSAKSYTDQLQTALEQKSPSILVVDQLRRAVESESGGRQTVIYTAKSQPCIMNVIPRFLMEDLPGWDVADGTGTHPAFLFNGVVASEIFIGAYQASEVAGEAISQPMAYPRVNINYDQARVLCQANGAGWDMMSNWDWAAVALWCMANGFQPRGNTQFGRHHDSRHETGRVPAGATIGSDATGVTNTMTGSGPNTWRHDNSPSGISDLVGNAWEWQTGLKLVDGVVLIAPDNGTYTEAQYTNTGYTMPSAAGQAFSGFATTAPSVLKHSLVMPKAANNPVGGLWTNIAGEVLPVRGGSRYNAGGSGLGALRLGDSRAIVGSYVGFRPRFRNP